MGLLEQFTNFVVLIIKRRRMFGDMMGMMGKLKETQAKVEATKKSLDNDFLEESSSDELIKVMITGNRQIKEITINESLLEDKDQLEDYLALTLNRAIERATQHNEAKLAAVAKEGMPNIPGMDNFFN